MVVVMALDTAELSDALTWIIIHVAEVLAPRLGQPVEFFVAQYSTRECLLSLGLKLNRYQDEGMTLLDAKTEAAKWLIDITYQALSEPD